MKALTSPLVFLGALAVAIVLFAAAYTVDMREQVIVTQFSEVVGEPIKNPGLNFKVPFIQHVNRIPKHVLEWDGPSAQMPTKDKANIVVDTFARWKIVDPLTFFLQLRDIRSAHSRLDSIIGSESRNVVARHSLIEVVRSTKDREATRDPNLAAPATTGAATTGSGARVGALVPIQFGRPVLERDILASARPKAAELGIELLDVRFKRINYNPAVTRTIYDRMVSERVQIAERFRSEGAGEAAKILGNRDRDLKLIESEAYKKIQQIEGAADAKATDIYARAYNQTTAAADLFEFMKAMDTLKKSLTSDTSIVFTTEGDLFRYLKAPNAGGVTRPSAPAPKPTPPPTPREAPIVPPPTVPPPAQ
jgi:membrane protease subunit HflC